MYRILASDGLQEKAINNLIELGFEVENKHYDKEVLGEVLKDFDALVVRSATKVTKEVIEATKGGKLNR